jgi:DNA-binding NtrC family response regulator
MAHGRVLITDDEPAIRFGVRDFLEQHGFAVDEAGSCREAEACFRAARPDAAIIDHLLPDGDALELLSRLREIDAGVPLLVLTGHGSIDLAVRAIKEGAEQFLTKPVDLPSLLIILRRLLEARRDHRRDLAGRSREHREALDPFLGTSEAIAQLAEQARLVVDSDRPILLQGETGSGKGVVARWLHAHGPRRDEAFVDLNCAGLSRELLESELFGHERGAFTGAVAAKVGLLEVGDRGTVFLDEIGDMDPLVQPRLLKALEEKRIRRLGDVRERRVDIRLIAATHQDFAALLQAKRFRSDLYYRISTLPLTIPPLRRRAEDVPLLARAILKRLSAELGRDPVDLAPDAEDALRRYSWPGNIRELRNVLERAALLSRRKALTRKDLLFEARGIPTADDSDTSLTLEELERRHIERVLREEHGRVETAAARLGIPRSSLYQKIKRFGISVFRF